MPNILTRINNVAWSLGQQMQLNKVSVPFGSTFRICGVENPIIILKPIKGVTIGRVETPEFMQACQIAYGPGTQKLFFDEKTLTFYIDAEGNNIFNGGGSWHYTEDATILAAVFGDGPISGAIQITDGLVSDSAAC